MYWWFVTPRPRGCSQPVYWTGAFLMGSSVFFTVCCGHTCTCMPMPMPMHCIESSMYNYTHKHVHVMQLQLSMHTLFTWWKGSGIFLENSEKLAATQDWTRGLWQAVSALPPELWSLGDSQPSQFSISLCMYHQNPTRDQLVTPLHQGHWVKFSYIHSSAHEVGSPTREPTNTTHTCSSQGWASKCLVLIVLVI